MAFHILAQKLSESEEQVVYSFYDTGVPNEVGELTLDKRDGSITMTKQGRDTFFVRAAAKVTKCYREGRFEDMLEWAS